MKLFTCLLLTTFTFISGKIYCQDSIDLNLLNPDKLKLQKEETIITEQHGLLQIGSDNNWVSIAVGFEHYLALKSDSTLWAWGDNHVGQLGDGTIVEKTSPVQIGMDNKWISIVAGAAHSLGLKSDGTLWAWGNNCDGQVGCGVTSYRTSPVKIGKGKWLSIAAGSSHTLGLKSNGTLWAWGNNYHGQVGYGTLRKNQTSPVQIGTDNKWMHVSAGSICDHSFGIKSDSTLWSWGDVYYSSILGPVQIGTNSKWISVVGGGSYSKSLGIKSDGTLWIWDGIITWDK